MSADASAETDPTMLAIREILHDSPPAAVEAAYNSAKAEPRVVKVTKAQEQVRANAANSFQDASVGTSTAKSRRFKLPQLQFQPSRKLIALTVFLAVLVLRPHWVFLSMVLTLFVIMGAFVFLGADKVWRTVVRSLHFFAGRSPERAQRLVKGLDEFALRWDGFLDRFPDGIVDGLYLPDFQSLMDAQDQHDAVVDARLSRLQAEG
jgi:hypothetical protein